MFSSFAGIASQGGNWDELGTEIFGSNLRIEFFN